MSHSYSADAASVGASRRARILYAARYPSCERPTFPLAHCPFGTHMDGPIASYVAGESLPRGWMRVWAGTGSGSSNRSRANVADVKSKIARLQTGTGAALSEIERDRRAVSASSVGATHCHHPSSSIFDGLYLALFFFFPLHRLNVTLIAR